MNETLLHKPGRRLLHVFTALLAGALATALLEVGLWMALFHLLPGEPYDAGFGGVAVLVLLIVTACIGIPLFSAIFYWLLRGRFARSGKSDR